MTTSTDPLTFDSFAGHLLTVDTFGWKLKFVVHYGSEEVDVTSSILACNVWFGETAPSIYGWYIELSGKDYDQYTYASGNQFDVYRTISLPSSYGFTPTEDLWYSGYLLPARSNLKYSENYWQGRVVDELTFRSSQRSPIIAIGTFNAASGAGASADSEATPQLVSNQLEFVGTPSLDAGRAVDGDLASLWISSNAPAKGSITNVFNAASYRVSEVYQPSISLDLQRNQWIELASNLGGSSYPVQLMTRSGIVTFSCDFGEAVGAAATPPRFAVVSYSANDFEAVWGSSPSHCPHYEWKNINSGFGFNLDDEGDYIATGGNLDPPTGRSSHTWVTNLVVAGTKMNRFSSGGSVEAITGSAPTFMTVRLNEDWSEDELIGCFVNVLPGAVTGYNKTRYISGNDAGVADSGDYLVKLYFDQSWKAYTSPWDWQPEVGDEVEITPYPAAAREIGEWPAGNVTAPAALTSVRLDEYIAALGATNWTNDTTPQVGHSGALPDPEYWPWLQVSPQEMLFYLAAPLQSGQTTVYLSSTIGLPDEGNIYVGLDGPHAYTGKTSETLTLSSAWSGATISMGSIVYSAVGSTITTEWPIGEVVIKRKRVPRLDDTSKDRVINSLSLYGSDEISPLVPDDEDWDDDWTKLFTQNNNDNLLNIRWISADEVRYKHYLVAIQSMSDETQGRINELELLVHSDFADGTITNTTGSRLLSYLIKIMGLSLGSVTSMSTNEAQIGSFSTDGSSYYNVISDLAVRTGNIVACDPLSNITITPNPNWAIAGEAVAVTTLTKSAIGSVDVEQRDDLSISQVQVQVQDFDGNIAVGVWPPVARNDGAVYKEPTLFSADTGVASQIARWLIQEKTSAVVTANLSGIAPWSLGGYQVIELDWEESNGYTLEDLWIIRGTEHKFNFGSSVVQPSWTTSLLLHRKI